VSDLWPTPAELEEIEVYRQRHGAPGMTAGEFEPFLPEHLKRPYWRTKIREFFEAEGIDVDTDGPS
jgi:hypothetical protein